jgi:hypothetical protein
MRGDQVVGINILTEFKTKDGRSQNLIALLRKLLPESLQHGGAEEISIRQSQDDPNDIVSAQRWESREAYQSYLYLLTPGHHRGRRPCDRFDGARVGQVCIG